MQDELCSLEMSSYLCQASKEFTITESHNDINNRELGWALDQLVPAKYSSEYFRVEFNGLNRHQCRLRVIEIAREWCSDKNDATYYYDAVDQDGTTKILTYYLVDVETQYVYLTRSGIISDYFS